MKIHVGIFIYIVSFLIISSDNSFAACQNYSSNRDYCGPSGNRAIARVIPDNLFGPFKGACESHDYCYYSSGSTVVKEMENQYQMSIQSPSPQMKSQFMSRMQQMKKQCDDNFYRDLRSACSRVSLPGKLDCHKAAVEYTAVVKLFADRAFSSAVDNAAVCR